MGIPSIELSTFGPRGESHCAFLPGLFFYLYAYSQGQETQQCSVVIAYLSPRAILPPGVYAYQRISAPISVTYLRISFIMPFYDTVAPCLDGIRAHILTPTPSPTNLKQ
ncbi:hypothetical protein BDBG_17205 [Blastomyces gilchristii SLH14081]|uniref:Uncharacterized protein n=1 Tax=Blastomyces gilchristii (strain SLH14081) TaxID=559298 RepID=A0A179UN25_BLAGS|nr:uncharacterized protein BDBG_17205 [Blastomyces gilchristii SLH14081]OAT09374.1 hypothetical protein BDBG_17205 [Blastomyces gilchristii SLH14081]